MEAAIVPVDAYTVDEFCRAHRISRSKLYDLWRSGLGPRRMMIGTTVRISREASKDFRRQCESADQQAA